MMASRPAQQVAPAAIDVAGISAFTATRSATDARLGQVYTPAQWAAAAPVHFHPMPDGRFLQLASTRWSGATQAPADIRGYTAHTASTLPSWLIINPQGHTDVVSTDYTVPTNKNPTRTLVAAATKSPQTLFTLNSTPDGGIVQFLFVTVNGNVNLQAEEVVPGTAAITFNAGLYVFDAYVYVFGTGTDGTVYLARKQNARIGTTTVIPYNGAGQSMKPSTMDPSWEYQTATGWDQDVTNIAPIATESGHLSSAGPITVANLRNQIIIATMADSSHAQVWASRGAHDPWRAQGTITGTPKFQPTLAASTVGPTDLASIPYLVSTSRTVSGASFIDVAWNTWAVPALS